MGVDVVDADSNTSAFMSPILLMNEIPSAGKEVHEVEAFGPVHHHALQIDGRPSGVNFERAVCAQPLLRPIAKTSRAVRDRRRHTTGGSGAE